jgi:hypothetical protein
MTITLDENNNLPQELLGNPKLSKEIDDLLFARSTSNQNPNEQIEDMSIPYIKPKDISKDEFEKDIDKALGLEEIDPLDRLGLGSLKDSKLIQQLLYGLDGTKEDMQGGIMGLSSDLLDAITQAKLKVQAEKNKVSGSPSSKENLPENRSKYRVAPVEIVEELLPFLKSSKSIDKKKQTDKNKEDEPLDITLKVPMEEVITDGKADGPDIKLKKKPKPPSKLDMFMRNLMTKDDFLMDLGARLMKGEGLFPGAIEATKTQKAADASKAATALQTELTKSLIRERGKPVDVIEIADIEARAVADPVENPKAYEAALLKSIKRQTTDTPGAANVNTLMMLSMMSPDSDTRELATNLLQQELGRYNLPTDGQGGGTSQPIISYQQKKTS